MIAYASILLALPAFWTLYNTYCLVVNYLKASKLGLPIIIVPVTPESPLWIAFQTAFGSILRFFPFTATSFTRHCRLGWEFHDRYRTHAKLGDIWMLVTPARNWLYVANAKAVTEIFGRGRDFINPAWMLEPLSVFGPSISTAEGQDWQRQRKLTAAPFNEQKSPLVWSESLRQARDMLDSWSTPRMSGSTTTSDDIRTLALHVLAFVAFQKSYPFKSVDRTMLTDPKSMTYRDSLAIILENVLIIIVMPVAVFAPSFMPLKWKQIGWAIKSFRAYMSDQLEDERQLIKDGKPGTGTLVSNLVRASDEAAIEKASSNTGMSLKPLTEAEILGNIFVFNFAGHDTTAISTAYAMLLLVASPQVQDWVHEELQYHLEDMDLKSVSYSTVFPKLKRCLAVLLETLRLYNPVPGVPKYAAQPTYLTVKRRTYIVPADTVVIPNLQASHTFPRHWGDDALTWRPQRWITGSTIEAEDFLKPLKGTYFPWSEGVRNCPGKRFAQVEFVAVMATLFQSHVAEPVPRGSESLDKARERVLAVVKDSNVELLLQIKDPESVRVRWRMR